MLDSYFRQSQPFTVFKIISLQIGAIETARILFKDFLMEQSCPKLVVSLCEMSVVMCLKFISNYKTSCVFNNKS